MRNKNILRVVEKVARAVVLTVISICLSISSQDYYNDSLAVRAILDANGFVSNAPIQTESATKAIIGLTGPGPAIFMLAGILFAIFYPLSRSDHAEIRKKLAEKKENTV
jgi:hypothetical protein